MNAKEILTLAGIAAAGIGAFALSRGQEPIRVIRQAIPTTGQLRATLPGNQTDAPGPAPGAGEPVTPDPSNNPLVDEPTSNTDTITTQPGEETAALPQMPNNLEDANTVTDPLTGTQVSVEDTINTEVGEETAAIPQSVDPEPESAFGDGVYDASEDDYDDYYDDDNDSFDGFEDDDATDFETSGGDTINDYGGASVL
jgi:hypothetical protein